jgi:uncharacterized protein (DUF302 family)
MTTEKYTLTRETPHLDQEQAIQKVRERLAEEGFGVLTTIDVSATLKTKLGVDRPPYVILGACNPALALQALEAEPSIGVLLPCNVDVFQENGKTVVQAVNPRRVFQIVANPAVEPIAEQVAKKLERVLEGL